MKSSSKYVLDISYFVFDHLVFFFFEKSLLKYTFTSHPDYLKLTDCLQKFSSANEKIEQINKDRINEMQIDRIQKLLTGNAPVS